MSHYEKQLARNNFDLLRLLFAGTVCLVHAYELSGQEELRWIAEVLSTAVAVKAFFVVSGFLIFMSYERSTSLSSYVSKRFRRIYPAYFSAVMLCAFGLAMASSRLTVDYFSFVWLRYVLSNLAFLNFLQPTLPGVFEENHLSAVNGALWTLKIEVMFYALVPVIAHVFRRTSHVPVMVLVYCASLAYSGIFMEAAERTGLGLFRELSRQLPGQLSYFISGAFLYYYLPLFSRYKLYFLMSALVVFVIDRFVPMFVLEPFALAVVVVFFGLFPYVGNFGRYGDFSYGTYILHFPIIQLVVQFGWFSNSPGLFLITVVLFVAVGAILMWHGIEKFFLLRSSHYVSSSAVPGSD